MSQGSPEDRTAPADPFGLWSTAPAANPPAQAAGESVSFALPGGGAGDTGGAETSGQPPEAVVPIWRLDLTSGLDGQAAAQQVLARRAGQVQGIFTGLEQAVPRSQALLDSRAQAASAGVSFSVQTAEAMPEPEAMFSGLLDQVQTMPPAPASDEVSFGLGQDLAHLAGTIKDKLTGPAGKPSKEVIPVPEPEPLPIPGWEAMQRSFEQMMDSVNRQLLHFCWVDTTLDGHLAAHTAVDWGGDMVTLWKAGLLPEQVAAHRRSLELAMQSRAASIKTVLTVVEVAGKLTLMVTTPLGPLQAAQAMVLGWKFVSSVVFPLLKQA